MKLFIRFSLLVNFYLISTGCFAASGISFGGFMALDLVDYRREENKVDELNSGIGVLDLKIYGNYDKFGAKIKLDLDDGSIGDAYNIFEEVTATYYYSDKIKLKAGKGIVPFHRKHWGVIQNCYIDSGSVLGASNSWRDLDNNVITVISYGNRDMGHISHLTYYGKSKVMKFDRDGSPIIRNFGKTYASYEYETNKTFSSRMQRGIAYKLELFPMKDFNLSVAALYYHHDYNPKENFAFDFGGNYKTGDIEFWFEFLHGFTSTAELAKYAALKKYESLGEVGFEYFFKDSISLLFNTGAVFVNQVNHDGSEDLIDNYKAEVGLGFYLSKKTLVTIGTLTELKKKSDGGTELKDRKVVELAGKLSFWF